MRHSLTGPLWLRLLVTVAILAYLTWQVDARAAFEAVLGVDRGALLLVLLLVACDRAVMILRWVLLLRASGAAIGAGSAARIFLVSSFIGSFLPAGVGGDAARAYGLARVTAKGGEALASVAVDRVLGILALVGTGVIGLFASARALGDWRIVAAIALLVTGAGGVFWADRLAAALVPTAWRDTRLVIRVRRLTDALSAYRDRKAALLHVFGWSVAVQLLRIGQAYFLGVGLGIDVPFRHYLVFMPVGLLMLLLPISISGFGAPQGVIVWLMRPLGVADEQSFALSWLIVLTGLAGNLPGMWLWLSSRGKGAAAVGDERGAG